MNFAKKQNRKSNREFWKNNRTYIKWYNRLKKIAVARFEWKNLPDTIDERYMEMMLFERGMVVFFWDEFLGYLCLNTTIQGQLNVYNIPKQRLAYANNGYQHWLNENDSVVIFNDYLHEPSVYEIEDFAYDLYETNLTKRMNIKVQKNPFLIIGTEEERLTLENLFMQYDGNSPLIYGTESLNLEHFQVIDLKAPFIAPELQLLQAEIWNEALTFLGIPNITQIKKSVMLKDETERMQGGAFSSRYSALEMRKQACKQINEMFGLDIDVEYRIDQDQAWAMGGWNNVPEQFAENGENDI